MKRVWLAIGLIGAGANAATTPPDSDEAAYPAIERFVDVMETVRQRYPDAGRVAYDRLVNAALEGMFASLDPFSSFIHPEMAAAMKEHAGLDPEIASLGLTLGLREDGAYIAAIAPRGPAAEAEVPVGASLVAVDGQATGGIALDVLLASLRRAAGETTVLEYRPLHEPQATQATLVHRWIDSRTVTAARLLSETPAIGYLHLGAFERRSAREVEAALDELEDAGMKSLIFDLRGNGGGYLDEAVGIIGLFVPPDTTVVTTRGRDGRDAEPLKTADRQRRKRDYPLVVLIDRDSASASELTAGALQDLKRAKVCGETSFGKGSVQEIVPLGGGTAVRLTIATYHTPSGATPHLKGISLDAKVEITDEDRRDFQQRQHLDRLSPEERAAVDTRQDPVIQSAIDLLKGS